MSPHTYCSTSWFVRRLISGCNADWLFIIPYERSILMGAELVELVAWVLRLLLWLASFRGEFRESIVRDSIICGWFSKWLLPFLSISNSSSYFSVTRRRSQIKAPGCKSPSHSQERVHQVKWRVRGPPSRLSMFEGPPSNYLLLTSLDMYIVYCILNWLSKCSLKNGNRPQEPRARLPYPQTEQYSAICLGEKRADKCAETLAWLRFQMQTFCSPFLTKETES